MKKSPGKRSGTASEVLLTLDSVTKKGAGNFRLDNISFSVEKLEKIAIAGETGAGKSTILKLIAGFIQPDTGQVLFEGAKVLGPEDHLVPGHPGIAYLSQQFELQKSLRVEQVLEYANVLTSTEADNLYSVCQIDHLLARRTDQLSGGEKQRVAICRLLISRPALLLLDEPFSHLDMVHKSTLKEVIRDIGEQLSITCMLVSHDPVDTLSWADKIIIMRDGRMVQIDSPKVIYYSPIDEYTGGLFGKYNMLDSGDLKALSGLKRIARMMQNVGRRGKIFLRPEQLRIVRPSKSALAATVDRVMFCGSFYEVEVTVSKRRLLVRTMNADVQPGTTVYLSLTRAALWEI